MDSRIRALDAATSEELWSDPVETRGRLGSDGFHSCRRGLCRASCRWELDPQAGGFGPGFGISAASEMMGYLLHQVQRFVLEGQGETLSL